MGSMRHRCDNTAPGSPGTRHKDSADEYSSQQGSSPAGSSGNVEDVTREPSTHERALAIRSVKNKGPAACRLILRHEATAKATRNGRPGERLSIAILQGLFAPFVF